jgi:hypothetical protein
MTFLKISRRKEMLREKPTRVVIFVLATAVVLSVGYIMTLAILAPEQLAEATAAATDLICDQCVGTTDIANGAVTSGKIGGGQVKNSDIAGNAVTSGKIADGQVFSSDIAAVTIGSSDIADSAVTSSKLAGGAVKPNVHRVVGNTITIAPGTAGDATADCPAGTLLTGGGFDTINAIDVVQSMPSTEAGYFNKRWEARGVNEANYDASLRAWAQCIGPSP